MVPKGKPMKVARSHAGQERRHSDAVMWTLLMRFWDSTVRPS